MMNLTLELASAALQLSFIEDILRNVLHPSDKFLYASDVGDNILPVTLSYSTIVINASLPNPILNTAFMYGRIDAYFLHFEKQNFSLVFENLSKMRSWNSRAKFIIYLKLFNKPIWEQLAKALINQYIYNVIVISNNRVFTYNPYKYENINYPHVEYEEITASRSYFPQKLPKLWRNSTIYPQYIQFVPYRNYKDTGTPEKGSDLTMFNDVIVKQLGLSNVELPLIGYWGTKLPNGEYNGGLSLVKKKKADLLIGAASNNHHEIPMDFDASNMYFDDRIIWIVPAAREQVNFYRLLHIFNLITWMLILATGLLLTCFWIIFARYSTTELQYFKLMWNASTKVLRFFFNEVEGHSPRTRKLQLISVLTWIFAFTVGSAFEGALIGKLTMKEYEHQISTVQEVIDNKLKITMPSFVRTSFDSQDSRDRYIHDVAIMTDTIKEIEGAIIELKTQRNVTAFITRKNFEFFLRRRNVTLRYDYVFPDGTIAVYPLEDFSILYIIILIFQKGHPMFEQINRMLMGVVEGGIYLHIFEELLHWTSLISKSSEIKKISSKAINYDQISGLVYVWLIGVAISGVVFCGELIKNTGYFRQNQITNQ